MKAAAPFVQNADHAIAQCRAPMCQGRGACRTGEGEARGSRPSARGRRGTLLLPSAIDFSEPLRLVRGLPIELGIVV